MPEGLKTAELIVLGCGDSRGTPRIGNVWGNCDPSEPKNIRTRPSICIKSETTIVVVDTGPDFKHQINRENIKNVDAVLYTHAHSDHVNGMDDLKPFYDRDKKRIPVYLTAESLEEVRLRFNYIFEQQSPIYPVIVDVNLLSPEQFGKKAVIGDIEFIPFSQDHGQMETLGYRFGDVGYSTDLINLDAAALDALKGIKTWIVDGANLYIDNPIIHLNLRKILQYNDHIGAEKIYLMHMKNDLDYQTLCRELPEYIRPAYDGLTLTVNF